MAKKILKGCLALIAAVKLFALFSGLLGNVPVGGRALVEGPVRLLVYDGGHIATDRLLNGEELTRLREWGEGSCDVHGAGTISG
ncbi:MAG: hypothetical protein KDB61_07500 [Planctomycetes bacterium]|nr:hypothetical protein [Planctomycetota bacterium]